MDYDEFSTDDFIGSTRVKLYEVLYSQSYKINIRRLLDDKVVRRERERERERSSFLILSRTQVVPTTLEDRTRGRVQLSFSYSLDQEMLSVYVHKADNLVPESTKGQCDPYVKW